MKNIISTTIQKIIKREQPKVLGRWNIDYCNKKINNKIDLSNEDHCGPCGQYALDKITTNSNNSITNVSNTSHSHSTKKM